MKFLCYVHKGDGNDDKYLYSSCAVNFSSAFKISKFSPLPYEELLLFSHFTDDDMEVTCLACQALNLGYQAQELVLPTMCIKK